MFTLKYNTNIYSRGVGVIIQWKISKSKYQVWGVMDLAFDFALYHSYPLPPTHPLHTSYGRW